MAGNTGGGEAMFKSVTYTGFENQPALLAKVRGLLPTLELELDQGLGPVAIDWRYSTPTLIELRIRDDFVEEEAMRPFDPAELERDTRFFPMFVRDVYLDVLQKHGRRWLGELRRIRAAEGAAVRVGA